MTRNTLVLAKLMFAVVIAAGLVALPQYLRSMADQVEYNQGRANTPPTLLASLYRLAAWLATVALPVVVLGTAAILRRWDRAVRQRRWLEPAACLLFFLLVFLGQEVGRRLTDRPVWPWKVGFRDWVRAEVDLPALRKLRDRLAASGMKTYEANVCPPVIQRTNPSHVIVEGNTLTIVWGGGFLRWYLEIKPSGDKSSLPDYGALQVADDVRVFVD